jgi:hypothetical protein
MSDSQQRPAAARFRADTDLGRLLVRDDPDRMLLTETEHRHALELKNRVERDTEIDNLSDFMYAQMAIICRGDVEVALEKCLGLQEYRKEYSVLDTYEEGGRCCQDIFEMFPEEFLSFSFSARDGTYVVMQDIGKFDPTVLGGPKMADKWLKSMYYLHNVFCPEFESIRRGILMLTDCGEFTRWRECLRHFKALFSELLFYYPFDIRVRNFNTGAMVNVSFSMLRPLLPAHLKEKFGCGFQFEGSMRDTFLVPSVEEANQRTFARMMVTLHQRYQNEKTFSLSPLD